MKTSFAGALLAGGWTAAIAGAYPVGDLDKPLQVRTVHLTFRGATSPYPMAFLADNTIHTASIAKDVSGSVTEDGLQLVSIGPPQPVFGVGRYGSCGATWGACEGEYGQVLGSCCNGFCATKLRLPWGNPSA